MASKSLGLEFAKQPASSFRPTEAERERMKQCGIIVVYEKNGLIKMDGACSDETGAFGGDRLYLQLPKREDHGFQGGEFVSGNRDKNIVTIDARKNIDQVLNQNYRIPWSFSLELPHHTFDLCQNGTIVCRGIYFLIPGNKEE